MLHTVFFWHENVIPQIFLKKKKKRLRLFLQQKKKRLSFKSVHELREFFLSWRGDEWKVDEEERREIKFWNVDSASPGGGDTELNGAESVEDVFGRGGRTPSPPAPRPRPLGRRVAASSHGHLGDLLFQSGDSTVLEDDAVPEWLELSEHLFQLVFHFLDKEQNES